MEMTLLVLFFLFTKAKLLKIMLYQAIQVFYIEVK